MEVSTTNSEKQKLIRIEYDHTHTFYAKRVKTNPLMDAFSLIAVDYVRFHYF